MRQNTTECTDAENGRTYGRTEKELYGNYCDTNMQQAARVADKTAFFFMGDLIEYGQTEQIFNNPQREKTKAYVSGQFG